MLRVSVLDHGDDAGSPSAAEDIDDLNGLDFEGLQRPLQRLPAGLFIVGRGEA